MSGLRDRGKKKWQSAFFMPEHVKMLHELRADYHKTNMPILDEYQVEDFEQKLCRSLEQACPINITIWENGYFKVYYGWVRKLDGLNKTIYLEQKDGDLSKITFSMIVNIVLEKD